MDLTKVDANIKIECDNRGNLFNLLEKRLEHNKNILVVETNDVPEDIKVFYWINNDWVLVQCWEVKLTDLYASILGSSLLKDELARNSQRHPEGVLHLSVVVKPTDNTMRRTKYDMWHICSMTNGIFSKFPWIRFSMVKSESLAIERIVKWVKKPPTSYDCGIPVLNIDGVKGIVSSMASLMNGMTTELGVFCTVRIKKKYGLESLCLKDLTIPTQKDWSRWFEQQTIKYDENGKAKKNEKGNIIKRKQEVKARKWYFLVNGRLN